MSKGQEAPDGHALSHPIMKLYIFPIVGVIALVCAGTAPIGSPIDLVPVGGVDCEWSGLDCGLANDECLLYDPVLCEAGSVGDPDGDDDRYGLPAGRRSEPVHDSGADSARIITGRHDGGDR